MKSAQTLNVPGYRVLQYLGRGAGSTIWRIRNQRTGQECALKRVIRNGANHRTMLQAIGEMQVAAGLDHPVIRKIHSLRKIRKWFRTKEVHLIMEFCEGKSLQDNRPNSVAQVVRIFSAVAEGLTYMNLCGYIHADIKPNNIILAPDGTVKVIDLGQSCPLGTIKDRIQGTPDFIAPEQVYRRPLDARTDVFNLGASLYWTLTGKPIPTILPNEKAVTFQADLAVTPADKLNPDVPPPLSKLVNDCIASNPTHRPESPAKVASRLDLIAHTIEKAGVSG